MIENFQHDFGADNEFHCVRVHKYDDLFIVKRLWGPARTRARAAAALAPALAARTRPHSPALAACLPARSRDRAPARPPAFGHLLPFRVESGQPANPTGQVQVRFSDPFSYPGRVRVNPFRAQGCIPWCIEMRLFVCSEVEQMRSEKRQEKSVKKRYSPLFLNESYAAVFDHLFSTFNHGSERTGSTQAETEKG
ncbi:hypothetical protein IEQ34_018588 [Dendrobium chrysotoxum]|uniref:Uncharacterized protein n=1 Tax=Dendrobium chrysotoxum TaxID=161865 RepID=A0AAV7FNX7_DENCH|nr:hypothetical protein IEQ34_018588 [Dendrobium chrysotoxum]